VLFNSYFFIFLFLPLTLVIYFILNSINLFNVSKIWLVIASLFFYGYWNFIYLPLILGSILFNYIIGILLSKDLSFKYKSLFTKRSILIFGIVADLMLLGYYKYSDFFISNANNLIGVNLSLLHVVLPLGISFFTFTQIAYLVDAYKGEVKQKSYQNYSLFATFFPHLLAGPIIHHKEMMPQFDNPELKSFNNKNLASGLFLFFIGLFKKVIIADTLAVWANNGFDDAAILTFIEAWTTSLSYTFQLYFDFSGYTDMALGSALMFNIVLPNNFNSPYKSTNIQDFWRRWHITLSRFLREYVYIPLGGNRKGNFRNYTNLMATFLIGGFWHGSGWTFIFWGFLHGLATIIHRVWQKLGFKMHFILAWFITFNFVNIAWVFFRAKEFKGAIKVIRGMMGLEGFILPYRLAGKLAFLGGYGVEFGNPFENTQIGGIITVAFVLLIIFLAVIIMRNSNEVMERLKPNTKYALIVVFMAVWGILSLNKVSEFIYFQF
jgi:alginate O-acetyltransferase complex protein AlgI